MQGDPKDLDATVAAVAFRDRLVPKADLLAHGVYPLWLGWALIEAFLAGIDYARKTDRSEVTRDDDNPHEDQVWRNLVAAKEAEIERLQTELEKARDGMQNALADAIKDAISDLDDHAGDDLPTRRFLAGVIDGLKKALFIAVSASPVSQNGESGE